MRSRLSQHLRYLAVSIVLLGTTGVIVGTTGVPLGASVACGCEGGGEEGGGGEEEEGGGGGGGEIGGVLNYTEGGAHFFIPVGTTKEYMVEYVGFGKSETLSVKVLQTPEFEYAGGTCNGKSIGPPCSVKVKCVGPKGAKGGVEVVSSSAFVLPAVE